MARVYYVQIRADNGAGEYTLRYESGPYATREQAEQFLGWLKYDDPNDPTPAKFTIDERGSE